MVVVELIFNLSLLVALSVLSGFVDSKYDRSTLIGKILQGVLFGSIIVVGMTFPYVLTEGIIFDGRSILISLSSLFFGPLAGFIASIIGIAYRIILGGDGFFTGVLVMTASFLIGSIFYYARKKRKINLRISTLFAMGFLVHVAMFGLMFTLPVDDVDDAIRTITISVLGIYPIITVLIGKIFFDQESHVRYLKELQQSEERFRLVMDSTEDIIYTLDLKQRHIGVYGNWVRRSGYTVEHFIGKTSAQLVGPEQSKIHESMNKRALAGDIVTYEWSFIVNDETHYVQTKLSPILNTNGVIIGLVGVGRYITDRRKAEIELKNQITKLSEIAWIQSHVVRAPLTRIMSLVDLLNDEKDFTESPHIKELLDHMMNSSRELDSIIHDISNKTMNLK